MFNIKVYNNQYVYKFTQNTKELSNDLSYTANTNGGQGRLTIEINRDIDQNLYSIGDFIEIKEYTENYKQGRDYYNGVVQNINLIAESNKEVVEIDIIGSFYLLNKVIYRSSGNRVFTKTDDPANIVNEIVSHFNTTYGITLFTTSPVLHGSSISLEFDNKTCAEALNMIVDKVNWYWYCGADRNIVIGQKPTTISHYLTYKKDTQMRITLFGEDIFNRLYLDYSGGNQTYNNGTSQTSYGVLEKSENKSDIKNLQTANEYGNKFNGEGDPKKQISIEVNINYDIGSIKPGDTIKVRNSKYQISGLQILKISRKKDLVSLELENLKNLGTLGKKIL